MDPESIVVAPSADNGNTSIEAEPIAPSADPTPPVAPTEPPAPVVPPTDPPAEPELYELPDGRKVDAVTLSKEWKENFYPDYTRKSQALAAKETPAPTTTPAPQIPATEEWVPQTWTEVLQKAKEEVKADQIREQQQQAATQQAVETEVISQLTEVKTKDPNVNENALFQHAIKYGFRDLRTAHQNMQDMSALAKNVQQTTVKNVQKRNDPVSAIPGATGATVNPTHFQSARDFLKAIKE